MSGEKYWAKRHDILVAMGPEWSIWDDLPSQPDEVESSNSLLCEGSRTACSHRLTGIS